LTSVPAANLTGSVPSGTLPANLQVLNTNNGVNLTNIQATALPTKLQVLNSNNAVNLTNIQAAALPANLQTLNGNNAVNLTNVNAATLGGLASTSFWKTTGNAGTTPGANYFGTSDNQALMLDVNGAQAFELVPGTNGQPNLIGGVSNSIDSSDYGTTIAGGSANGIQANAYQAFIGGGYQNTIQSNAVLSFIGAGQSNVTYSGWSVISGGNGNIIGSGTLGSTIGGGYLNTNSANYATVPGGYKNEASGKYSLAAGQMAIAQDPGTFVWADSQNGTFSSSSSNQFLVRALGGVGINSTNPETQLHVSGPSGASIRITGPGGNGNTVSFDLSTYDATTNAPAARIQATDNNYSDDLDIMTKISGASNNALVSRLHITSSSGDVGIGTTSPDSLLTVNGTADKPGGGSWTTFSDARLKNIGAKFTRGLEALDEIQPVHYHYKADNPLKLPSNLDYVGVVAQQLQSAVPEAVERNKDGYLTINNDPVFWTMVNAIKELNQKWESEAKKRDAEIAKLKERADKVDALEKQLNELKQMVQALAEKKPVSSMAPLP
jgi:hypothetical protein